MNPTVVIFGAGSIGRSFIAPVFTDGGYEAVFVDVNTRILDALGSRNHYTLVETSDAGEFPREISPVRGVDARDGEAVAEALNRAGVCVTCVGAAALPTVLQSISRAADGRTRPLDIILAENLKGAGDLARSILPDLSRFGIVETSIGKMVPIMPAGDANEDPLLCRAEPYNTLIVDAEGFIGKIPELKDLKPVSPVDPWVARKLYIHNFGHAATAYLGFRDHPEARYIWEVLSDTTIAGKVRQAMERSGQALLKEFPEVFSERDISEHIDDLLSRFANRALGDTIYRVGRDLGRKLQRRDRVVGAAELAMKHHLDPEPILAVLEAALSFAPETPEGGIDEQDRTIRNAAGEPEKFLREIVGLAPADNPALESSLKEVLRRQQN